MPDAQDVASTGTSEVAALDMAAELEADDPVFLPSALTAYGSGSSNDLKAGYGARAVCVAVAEVPRPRRNAHDPMSGGAAELARAPAL